MGSRGAPQTAVDERMPRNVAIATEAELDDEAGEVNARDGQRVLVVVLLLHLGVERDEVGHRELDGGAPCEIVRFLLCCDRNQPAELEVDREDEW